MVTFLNVNSWEKNSGRGDGQSYVSNCVFLMPTFCTITISDAIVFCVDVRVALCMLHCISGTSNSEVVVASFISSYRALLSLNTLFSKRNTST